MSGSDDKKFNDPVNGKKEEMAAGLKKIMQPVSEYSENMFELLEFTVDNIREAVYWATPKNRLIYINDSACAILGFSKEELLSSPPAEADSSGIIPSLPGGWDYLHDEKYIRFEKEYTRKDGKTIPIKVSASYINFKGLEYTLARIEDLSEQKEKEKKSEMIEAAYHNHFMKKPQPSYTWVREGNDFILKSCNDAAYEITFGKIKDKIGSRASNLFSSQPQIQKNMEKCFREKTEIITEELYTMITTGNTHSYIWSYSHIPPDIVIIHTEDISEREKLKEELSIAVKIFESTIEGIAVTDPEGNIITVNPAFTQITGYEKKEVMGKNPRLLKSDRHDPEFYKEMWDSLNEKGSWEGEIWNRRKNRDTYPEWLAINVIKDSDGNIKNYISVFKDISERKLSEETIKYKSYHDPLTGLPNRELFLDRLEQAISRSNREKTRSAVIFVDLDRFKIINDSLGHFVGDLLLKESARRLTACIRDGDTASRINGDEFALVLFNFTDINDVVKICTRITESFSIPFEIEENELYITPSMGISIYPEDGDEASVLFRNSDIAMNHSKTAGGNTYRFFSEDMNMNIDIKMKLELSLRRAFEFNQFELYFQPIIQSKKINGMEALIRWNHPDLGIIPPSTFIPVAEETGLIVQINEWVMKEACSKLHELEKIGCSDLYISINVTSHQFVQKRVVEPLCSYIKLYNVNPERLIIELTENSLMENIEYSISTMKELRAKGIRFSIDDFGTGYSSLSYLKKFPLDNLKIDRSFIVDIPGDGDSNSIARTIMALAKGLNFKVIAEGVETEEQFLFFDDEENCMIQGFYYSRPLPFNELLKYIDLNNEENN